MSFNKHARTDYKHATKLSADNTPKKTVTQSFDVTNIDFNVKSFTNFEAAFAKLQEELHKVPDVQFIGSVASAFQDLFLQTMNNFRKAVADFPEQKQLYLQLIKDKRVNHDKLVKKQRQEDLRKTKKLVSDAGEDVVVKPKEKKVSRSSPIKTKPQTAVSRTQGIPEETIDDLCAQLNDLANTAAFEPVKETPVVELVVDEPVVPVAKAPTTPLQLESSKPSSNSFQLSNWAEDDSDEEWRARCEANKARQEASNLSQEQSQPQPHYTEMQVAHHYTVEETMTVTANPEMDQPETPWFVGKLNITPDVEEYLVTWPKNRLVRQGNRDRIVLCRHHSSKKGCTNEKCTYAHGAEDLSLQVCKFRMKGKPCPKFVSFSEVRNGNAVPSVSDRQYTKANTCYCAHPCDETYLNFLEKMCDLHEPDSLEQNEFIREYRRVYNETSEVEDSDNETLEAEELSIAEVFEYSYVPTCPVYRPVNQALTFSQITVEQLFQAATPIATYEVAPYVFSDDTPTHDNLNSSEPAETAGNGEQTPVVASLPDKYLDMISPITLSDEFAATVSSNSDVQHRTTFCKSVYMPNVACARASNPKKCAFAHSPTQLQVATCAFGGSGETCSCKRFVSVFDCAESDVASQGDTKKICRRFHQHHETLQEYLVKMMIIGFYPIEPFRQELEARMKRNTECAQSSDAHISHGEVEATPSERPTGKSYRNDITDITSAEDLQFTTIKKSGKSRGAKRRQAAAEAFLAASTPQELGTFEDPVSERIAPVDPESDDEFVDANEYPSTTSSSRTTSHSIASPSIFYEKDSTPVTPPKTPIKQLSSPFAMTTGSPVSGKTEPREHGDKVPPAAPKKPSRDSKLRAKKKLAEAEFVPQVLTYTQ